MHSGTSVENPKLKGSFLDLSIENRFTVHAIYSIDIIDITISLDTNLKNSNEVTLRNKLYQFLNIMI